MTKLQDLPEFDAHVYFLMGKQSSASLRRNTQRNDDTHALTMAEAMQPVIHRYRTRSLHWVSIYRAILAFLVALPRAAAKDSVFTKEFRAFQAPLQNVLYVEQQTAKDVVVLAARNALYELLAQNLSLRATYATGLNVDSFVCPPYPPDCNNRRRASDNDNQVLLQLNGQSLILACGAADQGVCSIHDPLHDLEVKSAVTNNLSINNVVSKRSTTAFFGSGRNSDVLFVASAYDGKPELNKAHLFIHHSSTPSNTPSFVGVKSLFNKWHLTKFIYGFSYNGFAYFVTVQNKGGFLSTSETRLVRVCESNPSCRTYAELPIRCPNEERATSHYATIATSASLQHAGWRGENGEGVLAVAFGTALYSVWDLSDTSKGSELCFFDMSRVEAAFRETVDNCKQGTSKAKLSAISRDKLDSHCVHSDKTGGTINVGAPGAKSHLEGLEQFTGRAAIHFNGLATSVTAMQQNGITVAWVGDHQGYLHKVVARGQSSTLLFRADLTNGENAPIEKSAALDTKGAFGYFLTGEKVVKFPVGSCSIYRTCSECTQSPEDPLQCRWCDGICASSKECPNCTKRASQHCSGERFSANRRSRAIQRLYGSSGYGSPQVFTRSGPISGGTVLKLKLDKSRHWVREDSTAIEVLIGGHLCEIIERVASMVKCKTPAVKEALKMDIVVTLKLIANGTKGNNVLDRVILPSAFEYKIPSLHGVEPDRGPVAGGTTVTLLGMNLDIGSEQIITIGDKSCKLLRIDKSRAECLTSAMSTDEAGIQQKVKLTIDGCSISPVSLDGHQPTFTFMPDPVINEISPTTAFFSEAPFILVTGHNLNSVGNPKMVTTVPRRDGQQAESITTVCGVLQEFPQMVCQRPSAVKISKMSAVQLKKQKNPILVHISFQMDGLHLPLKSMHNESYFNFTYLPTPQYQFIQRGIADGLQAPKLSAVFPPYGPRSGGTTLKLRGVNLDRGAQRVVTVGKMICRIKRVTSHFIECTTSALTADVYAREMQVALNIDGTEVDFDSRDTLLSTFIYKPDPRIYDITPKEAPYSAPSVIRVLGENLDSVALPIMVTRLTDSDNHVEEYTTAACTVLSGGRQMECRRKFLIHKWHQLPVEAKISFQMDGLHLPRNNAGEESYFNYTYCQDQCIKRQEPEVAAPNSVYAIHQYFPSLLLVPFFCIPLLQ